METQLKDILKLSLSERVLWVEEIWNSIATDNSHDELMSVSPEHKKILDEELSSYNDNPASGSTWEIAKKEYELKNDLYADCSPQSRTAG